MGQTWPMPALHRLEVSLVTLVERARECDERAAIKNKTTKIEPKHSTLLTMLSRPK